MNCGRNRPWACCSAQSVSRFSYKYNVHKQQWQQQRRRAAIATTSTKATTTSPKRGTPLRRPQCAAPNERELANEYARVFIAAAVAIIVLTCIYTLHAPICVCVCVRCALLLLVLLFMWVRFYCVSQQMKMKTTECAYKSISVLLRGRRRRSCSRWLLTFSLFACAIVIVAVSVLFWLFVVAVLIFCFGCCCNYCIDDNCIAVTAHFVAAAISVCSFLIVIVVLLFQVWLFFNIK